MLNLLICFLILAIIAAGCYYASYQWVNLRHNRDELADEFKRATEHISELEERIIMLEANLENHRASSSNNDGVSGMDMFNLRG